MGVLWGTAATGATGGSGGYWGEIEGLWGTVRYYRVLRSTAGYYWVLLGTGGRGYWVVLGCTWGYLGYFQVRRVLGVIRSNKGYWGVL